MEASGWTFDRCGGRLCLDFANTVGDRPTEPKERLDGYEDLVSFARQSGVLDDGQAAALLRQARRRPTAAAQSSPQTTAPCGCTYPYPPQ